MDYRIRDFDTVEAAGAWVLVLFTEHNWDAPRSVIMRSMEPDATPEEKAAARRLWPKYDPADWTIVDEDGATHRVQRNGEITADDTDIRAEAEEAAAVDGADHASAGSGTGEGEDL
jgi:hypothetical protein